jgi:DNA repair exonuclease SbcCD ATPase subunit
MKFTALSIRNFLSIGEADLSLDTLGLVMVAGENLDETSADSNGSGKSSLADAVSWCLWGTTARGVAGDDVVNTAAGKNTKVSLTVIDGGETYRVDRYRKAPKYKSGVYLYKLNDQGEWDDLTKGTNTLTQKQIERLLGCSEEVFNAAVYSGQENLPDIPRMTDRQLKTLVEEAAGVDVLTNAYDIARERARDLTHKRAATQIEYDRTLQRHSDALDNLKRLSEQSTQWATDQNSKIEQHKQRTIDAKTDYELGKNDLDPVAEQKLREDIAAVEQKIAAVNDEREREQVLAGDVTTAGNTIVSLNQRIASLSAQLDGAKRALDAAEQDLEQVRNGVGKPCKSCSRPLEAEHLEQAIASRGQALEQRKQEYENALENLTKAQSKTPAADKLLKGAEDALAQHRAAMTDVSSEAQRLANLRREMSIVDRAKQEVERLKEAARNAALLWQREKSATNPFDGMLAQANDEIMERAAECELAKQAALAAQEEEAYAQAVVDVFAPAGVRAHRLDEATPYLNERTAHYLGSLADGEIEAFWTTLTENKSKTELREKFSVTVEKAGSAPNFNALSGGEKRKVRLACALALQDLVATRATKSLELWIGDEVDDALDDAGLERLMGVLEEKARDRGTVLVISHNDIRDFARKTITVTKSGGRATVDIQ